ncbi:MAG: YdeI/OmpD-associated family protein [Acidobacteria bacterium]|nr:YdeI/OmpD-associated family protein [Acidobacteriota bacterium]
MAEPILAHFKTPAAFRAWLRTHHKTAIALVLRVSKNHAAATGVTYAQALDEALCYGWIDGVRRRLDADSFSVRFSPRKPRSIWSRVNVRHAERLIQAKRMTKAGLAVFEAREEDRTGVYSFEQRPAELTPAFRRRFQAITAAWTYFQQEAPWYRRTTSHWVMSAKREDTRIKRLQTLIASSAVRTRIGPLSGSRKNAT